MDLTFKCIQCFKWDLLNMPPKIKSQKYYILYSVLAFVSIYFLKFDKREFVFRLLDTRCFLLPIIPFYAIMIINCVYICACVL